MEHYYFVVNDKLKGPLPLDEVIKKNLPENTLVWRKGMTDWAMLKDVADFQNNPSDGRVKQQTS